MSHFLEDASQINVLLSGICSNFQSGRKEGLAWFVCGDVAEEIPVQSFIVPFLLRIFLFGQLSPTSSK